MIERVHVATRCQGVTTKTLDVAVGSAVGMGVHSSTQYLDTVREYLDAIRHVLM